MDPTVNGSTLLYVPGRPSPECSSRWHDLDGFAMLSCKLCCPLLPTTNQEVDTQPLPTLPLRGTFCSRYRQPPSSNSLASPRCVLGGRRMLLYRHPRPAAAGVRLAHLCIVATQLGHGKSSLVLCYRPAGYRADPRRSKLTTIIRNLKEKNCPQGHGKLCPYRTIPQLFD
jgi:hypothetical protein